MAFVTAQRWANRLWTPRRCDVVDGQAEYLVRAWGVDIGKRLRLQVQSHAPLDRGRRFVLGGPGNALLDWYDAPTLAPFETYPGELAHLAEFGAHVSALRLDGPPTLLDLEHDLIFPPGTTFAYQGELTPEEVALGAWRPRAVVGSYAVFDPTGAKIAHIPCPVLVDATGAKYWGTISIANGRSRVRFPANIVAQVVFPCVVYGLDAFGFTSIGGASINSSADNIIAYGPHTCPANGTATQVQLYVTQLSNTPYTLGAYANNGGTPVGGALLGDSAGAVENTAGWIAQNLDASFAVVNGTAYWVGNNHDDDTTKGWYDAVAGFYIHYKAVAYSAGTLTNPYPSGGSNANSYKFSAQIIYTPAAGTVIPVFMHHYTKNIKAG